MTKKPKKMSELEETKLLAQRLQADFENYRRRMQEEKTQFADYMNTELILNIIPTLDHFQLALRHLPKELEGNSWVQGIWHVEKQLEQTLTDAGLSKIETVGQMFNHELHEAVEEVKSPRPPGEIVEEVLAGYKIKDKVIRHAKVRVSQEKSKKDKQ